jgi:hypothetical protein
MDWATIINTSVGLMALVLGGFSIWLALDLYTKAKDSETKTATTLEAIKSQSEMLQKLTGRWMDRFTRHATEPRPADEGLLQLVNVVATLPATILSQIEVIRPQQNSSSQTQALISEAVNGYVGLYYYTALSNVLAQALLPASNLYDESNPIHVAVRAIVDRSAADFLHMARTLGAVDQNLLQNSSLQSLLQEAINLWRPYVKSSSQVYAEQNTNAAGA